MKYIFLSLAIIFAFTIKAQKTVSIPAFSAYAVPAEETDDNGESKMFSLKNGIQHWNNDSQQLQFYFQLRSTGELRLSLFIKNDKAGNQLSVSIAGNNFKINVPAAATFKQVKIGSIQVKDTGFYVVTISAVEKRVGNIADIKSLELSGSAVNNIHYNQKQRRNAASVHLFYPFADSIKALSFYNEVSVPAGADVLHSYYMACGFERGYFGIQVNGPSERRVIFSVWDAGNEAVDRNKVAEENKVQLIAKGEDVFADGFGNEGTGGHSHWAFDWKAEETYKFLVTANVDTVAATTIYTGYFFNPQSQKWKLIASFKAPGDGKPLRRLYSFVENFDGNNGQLYRKAFFGNQWIRNDKGEWKELTKSRFSYDATGKAGDRIDYGAGVDIKNFYLWNGGFKNADARFNDELNRNASGERPVIDLYKNADSTAEYEKEKKIILEKIKNGLYDTTGSTNGVFYKILQEGTGNFVTLNDTLVVNYKGQLLNGFVFDQTKDKPAVFPLKRLIRGWQAGLPFCRQGGKIRLIIPSALAYSIRSLGTIPPNSILIFDVEVLEIKK